ncbi:hypothetical protein QL285_042770 [Trifolium repens]|nr:hypothetical protein QL285_042770 [Trifolium repens]
MARPVWALARAWPKTFYLLFGKKNKNRKKKTGKRAKWANQQNEQNLKTSFTLSPSLLSLARYTYSHTTSTARRALFDRHASVTTPSPPEKLQTPVHNHRLSLSARKSQSMKILEYF